MAKIATCPQCMKQLSLPSNAELAAIVECPECNAAFALSEAVQITLPVARLVEASLVEASLVEASLVETSDAKHEAIDQPYEPLTTESAQSTVVDSTPSLQGWEERLKKAIAASELPTEPKSPTVKTAEPVSKKTAATPNFDFELELPPAAEPISSGLNLDLSDALLSKSEFVTESKIAESKTLADYADEQEFPGDVPEAAVSSTPAEVASGEAPVVRRAKSRRVKPFMAAVSVGAVAGSLLGLYALLWVQGAQADYVGLARVLPASMLPAALAPPSEDAQLAQTTEQDAQQEQSPDDAPAAPKRDEAVTPAMALQPSAEIPVTTLPSSLPASAPKIDAAEFSLLVDEAIAVLPSFLQGDLSDRNLVPIKGQAYVKFCQLAQHMALANQLGLAPTLDAKVQQARQLFQQLAAQPSVRSDLAYVTSMWWQYAERPNRGMFLLGRVQRTKDLGQQTLAWLQADQQPSSPAIPVLLPSLDLITQGDTLAIAGHLTTDTNQLPPGFAEKQMVVAEYTFGVQP